MTAAALWQRFCAAAGLLEEFTLVFAAAADETEKGVNTNGI